MDYEAQRFQNLVHGLAVDDDAFREKLRQTTPPRRHYVVLFTARSGSTWLNSLLTRSGVLGYPEEYINPDFIPSAAATLNAREPARFLTALTRLRQTPNGVFGMGARAVDVDLFSTDVFFEFFDRSAVFFNLRRENLVAQAISLFRAVATGRYHSHDGQPASGPPRYDPRAISDWLSHLTAMENWNVTMLRDRGRPFIELRYERMVTDAPATLQIFAGRLEVDAVTIPASAGLEKIGDGWNLETEQRYRRDAAGFVQDIEAARIAKQAG